MRRGDNRGYGIYCWCCVCSVPDLGSRSFPLETVAFASRLGPWGRWVVPWSAAEVVIRTTVHPPRELVEWMLCLSSWTVARACMSTQYHVSRRTRATQSWPVQAYAVKQVILSTSSGPEPSRAKKASTLRELHQAVLVLPLGRQTSPAVGLPHRSFWRLVFFTFFRRHIYKCACSPRGLFSCSSCPRRISSLCNSSDPVLKHRSSSSSSSSGSDLLLPILIYSCLHLHRTPNPGRSFFPALRLDSDKPSSS